MYSSYSPSTSLKNARDVSDSVVTWSTSAWAICGGAAGASGQLKAARWQLWVCMLHCHSLDVTWSKIQDAVHRALKVPNSATCWGVCAAVADMSSGAHGWHPWWRSRWAPLDGCGPGWGLSTHWGSQNNACHPHPTRARLAPCSAPQGWAHSCGRRSRPPA